ncbi:MAG: hypothetical protein R3C99_11100 [Pirellulaceae bacterium]
MAHKKIQPAVKPSRGESQRYPYSYVPPLTGQLAGELRAAQAVASGDDRGDGDGQHHGGPSHPAAIPMLTNTPVPTIEPHARAEHAHFSRLRVLVAANLELEAVLWSLFMAASVRREG